MEAVVEHALPQPGVHQHRFAGDLQPDHADGSVFEPHRAGGGFARRQVEAFALMVQREVAEVPSDGQQLNLLLELAVGGAGQHPGRHVQLAGTDGLGGGGGQCQPFGLVLLLPFRQCVLQRLAGRLARHGLRGARRLDRFGGKGGGWCAGRGLARGRDGCASQHGGTQQHDPRGCSCCGVGALAWRWWVALGA